MSINLVNRRKLKRFKNTKNVKKIIGILVQTNQKRTFWNQLTFSKKAQTLTFKTFHFLCHSLENLKTHIVITKNTLFEKLMIFLFFQFQELIMTTLDELSKNIEAMSMSSILTDIATPPPPPPPLEIERWRTLSKSYRYDNLIWIQIIFKSQKNF